MGPRKKRVLFLNPVGQAGGAEKALLSWMKWLKRNKPDYELVLLVLEDGPLRELAQKAGVQTLVLELPQALSGLGDSGGLGWVRALRALDVFSTTRFLLKLKSKLRAINPDLIHTNGMKAHILASWSKPKSARLVWHVHDFVSGRPWMRRLLRYFSSNTDRVICVSQAVAEDFKQTCPSSAVAVARNGIDFAEFFLGSATPGKTVRVGLVATYARWKGHDVFIRAAAEVLKRNPGAETLFSLIGGPIYRTSGSQFTAEELRRLIDGLGVSKSVSLVDFQNDVGLAYRNLDIVVHASVQREPFGLSIAEAMACGCAVIAAPGSGALEPGFEEGEEPALVVKPDPAALADAIVRLIRDGDLRARLRANARAYAEKNFGLEKMGQAIFPVYEELLGAGGALDR